MKRTSPLLVGTLTLVMTLLGWSSVPLFLRYFSDTVDLWTSNGWRYGFSALVWAPVLIIAALRTGLPRGLWRAALIPSIVNAAGQVCFTWSHYCIEPALVTFGLRSQLIFVAIGAWIMFPRERAIIRTPSYLIGAAILLLGVMGVLLMKPEAAATDSETAHTTFRLAATTGGRTLGILLAIGSGFLFACYGLAVRKYMDGVNSVLAFAAICQYTALAMVVLMLALGERAGLSVLDLPASWIAKLLLSALIGIAIGHVFYYISLARLGVAVTAGVLQLQPFLVAIGSIPLFGESLALPQWLSGSVAVAGALTMLTVQWRMSRAKRISERPLEIAEGESGA